MIATLSILCVLLYVLGTLQQALALTSAVRWGRGSLWILTAIAAALHGFLLYYWIDTALGQNLNVANMFSLLCWLMVILVSSLAAFKTLDSLVIGLFPLTAFSIVMVWLYPHNYIVNTATDPVTLFHIVIAVTAFGVLCLAGLISVLLAVQEHLLRFKIFNKLLQQLPPLQLMEQLLFQVIKVGMVLLTILISTSCYFFHNQLLSSNILPKVIVAVLAWWVFAILLIGRWRYGWRGDKVIYGTLTGVGLLFIAYFVSKILLEVVHS